MAEHSSAMRWVSSWVPAALAVMAAALPATSSRAAESGSVSRDRVRTLSLECRARWRTSPTTPLIRSELSWRVPIAPRIGAMTCFRMIRRAAHTRSTPAISQISRRFFMSILPFL